MAQIKREGEKNSPAVNKHAREAPEKISAKSIEREPANSMEDRLRI